MIKPVGGDDPGFDGEPLDAGVCRAVVRERIDAGGGAHVRVARTLEGIGQRLSNALGFDTPLPPLEATSHGSRLSPICLSRYAFHIKCLRAFAVSVVVGVPAKTFADHEGTFGVLAGCASSGNFDSCSGLGS